MIGFIFRCAAAIILMIAVIYGVVDSAISVGSSAWQFTSFADAWEEILLVFPHESLAAEAIVDNGVGNNAIGSILWDRVSSLPVWSVLLAISFLLYAIGYKTQKQQEAV